MDSPEEHFLTQSFPLIWGFLRH